MEPIKWYALTPAQRDEVVHEKIFGHERKTKHFLTPDRSNVWSIGETYKIRSLQTWQTGGPDTPRYSQSLDAAWEMVRVLVGNHSDTYDRARLFFRELGQLDGPVHVVIPWADFRDLTAETLCIAALRACGHEVLTEEVKAVE